MWCSLEPQHNVDILRNREITVDSLRTLVFLDSYARQKEMALCPIKPSCVPSSVEEFVGIIPGVFKVFRAAFIKQNPRADHLRCVKTVPEAVTSF